MYGNIDGYYTNLFDMFEKLNEISIKGGPFTEFKSFPLFSKRLNVLYGRNGSGKSTIAKCIRNLGNAIDDAPYQIEKPSSLNSEAFERVFVFDEDFVAKNVQVEQDGLSTVVMLGQQIELAAELKKIQGEKRDLVAKKNELVQQKLYLEDSRNKDSLLSLFNQIKKQLVMDDGWADRDKQIKGNVYKSSVTKSLLDELMEMKITPQTYSKLQNEYVNKFEHYRKIRIDGQRLEFFPTSLITENFRNLLEVQIERPVLNNRDKSIIELVLSQHGDLIEQIHPIFDNPMMTICPLCFRPISQSEKQGLFEKIQDLFSNKVDNFKHVLLSVIGSLSNWKAIELSSRIKELIGSSVANEYLTVCINLQDIYSKLLYALHKRYENVYGTQVYFADWDKLHKISTRYTLAVANINSIITQYNKDIAQKEQLKDDLIAINKKIAAFRVFPSLDAYKEQLKKQDKIIRVLESIGQQVEDKDKELSNVYSNISQTSIALKFMNDALAYIFFDKKRMTLEFVNGKYALKSNGKDVRLKNVSTGERNAIALCYFFAKCFENHGKDDCYSDEMLVVLDDPITSFDKDNKVGMMSFLRWQVGEIYNGNQNSKVLIMSHDLSAAFQIQKMYMDINSNACSFVELRHGELENKNCKGAIKNEYQLLMDDVFAIANGISNDISSIGNKMRKLEEAYSTFIANKGFASLLHDAEFLQKVPPEKQIFYQNFMSRLVLNTESHTEEKVYGLDGFTPMFDEEEIRKTAKYLLMLFYHVDRFHLKSYLKDKMEVVQKWISDENAFSEI